MNLYQLSAPLLFLVAKALAQSVPSHPIAYRNVSVEDSLDFAKITPSTKLEWRPCHTNLSCAVLEVPLDYAKPQGNRALVPLLKYPATKKPYKGLMLTNPGGPGTSAIDFLVDNGLVVQSVVGYDYDLVAWEPRGIGYSMPLLNCTSDPPTATKPRFIPRRDQFGNYFPHEFFEDLYEKAGIMGKECQEQGGGTIDAGPRMSTATIVRDMVSILDAYAASPAAEGVDGPTLLNYWGFSYGTIIGQTFASMFPSRIGKVALDGVSDPKDSATGSHLTWLQSTDEAFSTFFMYCHLAGAECPYFTGTSVHDIFLRFERTISRLDPLEATRRGWENSTAIGQALEGLKDLSFLALYTPFQSFPMVAQMLVLIEQAAQNLTMEDLDRLEDQLAPDARQAKGAGFIWQTAVSCEDNGNVWRNATQDDVMDRVKLLRAQSYIGGDSLSRNILACTGWSIQPDERFAGPFGGTTKNPMLFIGNTRDPVTPIYNAQRGVRIFPGARLLTIDGTGHTSFNTRNNCAFRKINAYFQNGTLPNDDDSFCALETGPFNVTIAGAIEDRNDWKKLQKRMKALAR